MRRTLATSIVLMLGSGCFLFDPIFAPSAEHGKIETPEAKPSYASVPTVFDRHLYGSGAVGQWARYKVNDAELEIACVAESAEGKWYEFREGKRASSRLVSPDGKILKAYYAEEPFETVVAQEIVQTSAGAAAPGFESMNLKRGPRFEYGYGQGASKPNETIVLEHYEDDLGFDVIVSTTWARELPQLYAGEGDQGLSERDGPRGRVQLKGHGTDATFRIKVR